MFSLSWVRLAPVLALALVATAVACGDDDDDGNGDDGVEVRVSLDEWSINPDGDTAAPGLIRFEANNDGTQPHELVVIRSDEEPDGLPIERGLVPEDQIEVIGEIEEFPAGETQAGTFDLEAGNYILICNLPAHYQQGMHAAFTVE